MKYYIVILFLLASVGATAQVPGYTRINSGYNWLRGAFDALNVPSDSTARFQPFQLRRAGAMVYDSLGDDKGLKIWDGSNWLSAGSSGTTWQDVVNNGGLNAQTSNARIYETDSSFVFEKRDIQYPKVTLRTWSDDLLENYFTLTDDTASTPKRISYASNINSTLTANSLVTKGYADSISRRFRFGVPGEDEFATATRTFDMGTYTFKFFNENGVGTNMYFDLANANFIVESDKKVSIEGADSVVLTTQNNGEQRPTRSEISIHDGETSTKGITMKPWQGKLIIDTLYTTSTTAGKLMMLHDTVTGQVWRTPLPATGVTSSTSSDNAIARYDGTTGQVIQNSGAFITDAGNLGVGIASATEAVHIQRSAAVLRSKLENLQSGGYAEYQNWSNGVDFRMGAGPGGGYLATATNDPFRFVVNNSDVAVFNTSGNFGIGNTSPNERLSVTGTTRLAGSVFYAIRTVTSTATINTTDRTVLVDASSGPVIINLPSASTVSGIEYIIKKIDNSANTVLVDPNSTETIDGIATLTLTTQWEFTKIQSNGTAWYVIP